MVNRKVFRDVSPPYPPYWKNGGQYCPYKRLHVPVPPSPILKITISILKNRIDKINQVAGFSFSFLFSFFFFTFYRLFYVYTSFSLTVLDLLSDGSHHLTRKGWPWAGPILYKYRCPPMHHHGPGPLYRPGSRTSHEFSLQYHALFARPLPWGRR